MSCKQIQMYLQIQNHSVMGKNCSRVSPNKYKTLQWIVKIRRRPPPSFLPSIHLYLFWQEYLELFRRYHPNSQAMSFTWSGPLGPTALSILHPLTTTTGSELWGKRRSLWTSTCFHQGTSINPESGRGNEPLDPAMPDACHLGTFQSIHAFF